jgi:N-acylglucosamine 2-epimerase
LRSSRKLLYEFVRLDNSLMGSPMGRAVVPGHAIESMWFMMHIYRQEGEDHKVRRAIEAVKWHLEAGWDEKYGGLLLGLDAEGKRPWWKYADTKIWWPHTEALYALLLAYDLSNEEWCLEWFQRVHQYAFSHFPVAGYGEWTQRLDRRGKKLNKTIALPVKDPFHLPRSLMYCIPVLQKLSGAPAHQGAAGDENA